MHICSKLFFIYIYILHQLVIYFCEVIIHNKAQKCNEKKVKNILICVCVSVYLKHFCALLFVWYCVALYHAYILICVEVSTGVLPFWSVMEALY